LYSLKTDNMLALYDTYSQ